MVLIDYVGPQAADANARELLERDAETYGRPSLFARVVANNPAVLDARMDYTAALMDDGGIDRRIAELVYLAVSVTNDCEYCIASHREVLVENVGVPTEEVEALARNELAGFAPEARAAIEFAVQVALDPRAVDADQVSQLHDAGFDDADVIQLLAITTAAISANTIADALDIHPSDRDEPFA